MRSCRQIKARLFRRAFCWAGLVDAIADVTIGDSGAIAERDTQSTAVAGCPKLLQVKVVRVLYRVFDFSFGRVNAVERDAVALAETDGGGLQTHDVGFCVGADG